MKQAQNLHPTASRKLEKPLSHRTTFSQKHPILTSLFKPKVLLMEGLLLFGGVAAHNAFAKPPTEQPQGQLSDEHKKGGGHIKFFDPGSISDKAEYSDEIKFFNLYLLIGTKPTTPIIRAESNGFVAESFQDNAFRVTKITKNGELIAVYTLDTYPGHAGFLGVARNSAKSGTFMTQFLSMEGDSPLTLGCALQPDGSPVFVSKTHMFVVDWKDDGNATVFTIASSRLASGITELDPSKLRVGYYTDNDSKYGKPLGECLIIYGEELAGAFYVPMDPKNVGERGFLPNTAKSYNEVMQSLHVEPVLSYLNSR